MPRLRLCCECSVSSRLTGVSEIGGFSGLGIREALL